MKIISGRAKSGKSKYIYDQINDEIQKNTGDNLVLLVPDLMTYQTEYDIIERLELEGIMNLQILSFKTLANKIMDEIGGLDKEKTIDSLGRSMILTQIFEENRDRLKLYKRSSSHTGFLKQFNRLIQELKQNTISVNDLENAIKGTDNLFFKNKLSDIALVYSIYNERIKDVVFDEQDIHKLVISNIEKSNYIRNSKIWIDGFESFDKQRINLILNLSRYSKDLSLSLNIDISYMDDLESFDDWEAFKTIYDTFSSIKSQTEDDIEIISLDKNGISSEEIKIIERNVFSIELERYDKSTDNIQIYSSMDQYSEIEATAHKMISLVRDHGYRWKDIKIAVSDLDSYIIDIKKIFNKFDIPYFADTKRDITNNPLSVYILSILDIFIWNFRYDDVFQYLKTGFSLLSDSEINHLENYSLQYGIQGLKWFKSIDSILIEDIRSKFIAGFKVKTSEFKELSTIAEFTCFLLDYLRIQKIDEKMNKYIDKFKIEHKYEQASEYSQVWNSMMNVFEQILLIGQTSQITALEYRNILEAGLKEIQLGIIPPTIDTVEVGDIESIATSKAKALFILGANEGKLDFNKTKGLILDEELETLLEMDIKIVNCSSFFQFKKKHMLYKLFTAPKERLYISYSLGASDGKSLQSSLYIDTLKRIFPYIKEETDLWSSDKYKHISNSNATYENLIEVIRRYMDTNEIDDNWKSVYNWYKDNDAQKINMMTNGLNYKNKISIVEEKLMDKVFDRDITMTVSKLESYAACKFKYFIDNILKIKPRLNQQIEFYDLGNINHNVLEDFINKIIDSDEKIIDLTEECVYSMIDSSIDKVIYSYSKKVTALDANSRNSYLKEKIKRVLRRTGIILINQLKRGEFTPRYTELQIGLLENRDGNVQNINSIEPLEIKTKNHSIKLRGKIDRVDTFEDENGDLYLSIIDYKSSSKNIDFTDTYEGIQMQLLVYLNAVLKNGKHLFEKEPKVAGIFYYQVDDPIIKDESEDIDNQILKSLKLKGFVLKDKKLIYKMDKDIGTYSDIIPAGIKKDGEFSSHSSVFTEEEFDAILSFIDFKTTDLSQSILDGNFEINPYRKKNGTMPCTYCDYISICQFDKTLGNAYRQINKLDEESFFDKISVKAEN